VPVTLLTSAQVKVYAGTASETLLLVDDQQTCVYKYFVMFLSLSSSDTQQVLVVLLLCLLEATDRMMFPSFQRAALFALPASAAYMHTTLSETAPTKSIDEASITSTYSGATESVLINGTYST
jgi:hypothetical protein